MTYIFETIILLNQQILGTRAYNDAQKKKKRFAYKIIDNTYRSLSI